MATYTRCRGVRSIQLEISMRIKRENSKAWAKPMRDKEVRNFYRHEILEENDGEWCDFIAGTCVCHKPQPVQGTKWDDVFPDMLNTLKEEIR